MEAAWTWWIASACHSRVLVVFCENEKEERFQQALSLCNHTLALLGLPKADIEAIPELIPAAQPDQDLFLGVRNALEFCDTRLARNMPMLLSSSQGKIAIGLGYNKIKVTRAAYLALAISMALHHDSKSKSTSQGLLSSLKLEASRAKVLEISFGGQPLVRPSPKRRPSSHGDQNLSGSCVIKAKRCAPTQGAYVKTIDDVEDEVPDWQKVYRFSSAPRMLAPKTSPSRDDDDDDDDDGPRPPRDPPPARSNDDDGPRPPRDPQPARSKDDDDGPRPPRDPPPAHIFNHVQPKAMAKRQPYADNEAVPQDYVTSPHLVSAANRFVQRRSAGMIAQSSNWSRSRSPVRATPGSALEEADDCDDVGKQCRRSSPSYLRMDLVNAMAKGVSRFDPAQDENACLIQGHLLGELDVRSLLQTHDNISEVFRNGEHRGTRVVDLTARLLQGVTKVDELPPLVVVRLRKENWVVFGNRRLRALKDYCAHARIKQLLVKCVTYDLDSEAELPGQLVAKFLSATTTQNHGRFAPFVKGRNSKPNWHCRN